MDLMQHAQRDELHVRQHMGMGGLVLRQPVVDGDDDEFDEFEEDSFSEDGQIARRPAKTGVPGAVFSYICTCVGAGVLSLPRALQECGWIGLILMAFVAVLCNTTAKYLSQCMFARPGVMLKSYEAIGEQALGKRGRRMVAFFQTITLFGVCTIFLILIGGNMSTLVPSLSLHDWIFIFAGILIPIAWLKTMNEVAILAVFGVIASLYVAAIVVIKGFMHCAHPGDGVPSPKYEVANWSGLSNAVNIIVFSFSGHSVLPNIISHVRAPQKNYAKVTTYSHILIGAIYGITAAGGYAGWGVDTSAVVLDNMSSSSPLVKSAYAFITAHVVLAYPIPLNPMSLALGNVLGYDSKKGMAELIPRIACRTGLVLLTVLVASIVPYFKDILSLVSALSVVVVAFILPPIFLFLLHPHRVFSLVERGCMIFIVIFGCAASSIGLYYAIHGLADSISENPNPFAHYF